MGSEVKFRYGDNIKGLADSKKEQGTFYYDKSNQRLYLYTPSGASDSATLIPIGQSIIKVSSTSAISTYDDNAFYLDDNGNLYYYNSTINIMPQQIARLSDIEEASTSTNENIVNINNQLNTIQSNIINIEKEIGDPKVTGGTNATGLYVYLDNLEANKVDNTVFESYKTAQANEFETYKNEADAKFLSADEDLFLVSGDLKYGKLENGEWTDDENSKPYIILVLKNNNDGDTDNNTIYIPAEDLVDVYTVTDTDTVDMTLTGLDIKADVKTANLINSTAADTVTLSVEKNKIKTGFNTSNIIVAAKDSDTVNLSVIDNQIAAAVNTSNIIDEDTLEINTDNLINVNVKRLIKNQDNAQVLLKYHTSDDALYAELSDSVKLTLNNANTTGNLINKNSEAIDANKALIETNKAEFNTYKEEHATEFSAYQETIGAYSYKDNKAESSGYFEQVQSHIDATNAALTAEKTARKEADTTLQGNIDSVSSALDTERSRAQSEETKLQANINAIYKINDNNVAEGILAQEITRSTAADTTLTENLNTEIQNRENGDATLQGEIETLIDDVAEDFNIVNARIDAIYLKDGNAAATGLLADEITRSVQADADLDAAIQQVQTNLDTKESNLESLINNKESQINAKIDSLYKVEEITSEDGTTSTSITGTIHNEIVSISEQLSSAVNELEDADGELQEQITANKTAHDNYVVSNNAALAQEISDRATAISNIGTYEYQEKNDNTNAEATVVEDTYFAEVKKHIEGEAAEIRAEFAAADNVLSNRLDTTDDNIANEIKRVEDLISVEAKSREDDDNALITRLDNLYVAETDTATASGLVENNRLAIEVINTTTIPQAEEKINENKTNITNLKTAYDAAIVVNNGVLLGGQVKAYIDSQDNKLSEEIQNIVSNNAAGVYQTKADANARFTFTTVGETTTYSGTIVDAYKAADEVLDNKFNNYYTIEEAEEKFLSADEDLFLVSGAVKTGSLTNGEWQDNENGDAYIYLELKNNNDTGTDVNALYIPANELVDTYEANNANEASVEVTVSNYQISADLSSTIKDNIKQGVDAYSAVSDSSTGLAAAHTAINDINTSLTNNVGTYSYSNDIASATGNYFGAIRSHIEAIKNYSDNEDVELKKLIDTNTGNIKINTDRLADLGKFTSATETGYNGELKLLYDDLNSKLTGDIGTAVSALETGAVANNATNINNINTKLSAYGINDKSNDIYSLGDGVLKTYIDEKYGANLEAINTNAQNITKIGTATGSETSFASSGYLQTLYDKTVVDNNALSSALIGNDEDTFNSNTIYGVKKYSDANKAAAIAEAQTEAAAAAKTVYNTYTAAGTDDTQYPILGGTEAKSGNTQAVSYSKATISAAGNVRGNKVYGSVWNDYAEYRQTHHKVRPGQCVYEKGDGSLAISYERMMPGANIVSDTFGFAIGETNDCKTPLAVSGRVLAYPYEPKEEYKAGDAVCSGPNGTISKMTRAEIRDYPERIVGTVSEIPTYEVWGSGNVKVNGRIWIKVR